MDKELHTSSTFNMSLATLIRIDIILTKLHEANYIRHPLQVTRYLEMLFKELYPFLETKKKNTEANTEAEQVTSHMISITTGVTEVDSKDSNTFVIAPDFWTRAFYYEILLRSKLHEKGLLMAKPDNPSFAIG